MLYIFEDNAAVIKMIIIGRSPRIRHVSRTHRVTLDWLFGRIHLDPKIQITFVDTKLTLTDILTKGNFIRKEWNNLLHLLNISHFSLLCCSQNFSLTSCIKRWRKDARTGRRREDRDKVKADELGVIYLDKFFDCAQSDCVKMPGITQGTLSQRLSKYSET